MSASVRGGLDRVPITTRWTSVNWGLVGFFLVTLTLFTLALSLYVNYWLAAAVLLLAGAGSFYAHQISQQVHQVTRRREQDLARLREDGAVIRHILDAAGDGIFSVDEDGQVQYVNQAAARLFGYSAADLVGVGVWMLVAAPNLPGRGRDANDLNTGEARVFDAGAGFEGRRKDGSTFPVEPAVSKTRADQRYLFTYVIRDLTERKKAEEALRKAHDELDLRVRERTNQLAKVVGALEAEIAERKRAQQELQRAKENLERLVEERTNELKRRALELEATNAELGAFTYSVSHDLRAPLRAVSGFAQIVARRHRGALNEEGQHYVDNIVEAAGRMGRLIDDLLEYARLGRQSVQRQPVPLHEVLVRIARDLTGRLRKTGGQLHVADGLPAVNGDWTLLAQVFTNLLDNALTYRRPGVPVRIEVTARTGAPVVVAVADNGIGIAAEYFEKIFHVFQRLHSADEYPGTGIGLATVKKAVELLGGRVWVESVVGAGSTFFVELPRTPDGGSEHDPPRPHPAGGRQPHGR